MSFHELRSVSVAHGSFIGQLYWYNGHWTCKYQQSQQPTVFQVDLPLPYNFSAPYAPHILPPVSFPLVVQPLLREAEELSKEWPRL